MPFVAPEQAFDLNGRAFVLRRPGMGGLMRIPNHVARLFAEAGMLPGYAEQQMGQAIEMRALLVEYAAVVPDDWKAKKQPDGASRPAIDFDAIDPAEFAEVGRRAVEFHAGFRELDAQFGSSESKG